jgi:hypothetical protein
MLKVVSKICEKVALNQFNGFLNRTDRLSFQWKQKVSFHRNTQYISKWFFAKIDGKQKAYSLVRLDLSKLTAWTIQSC